MEVVQSVLLFRSKSWVIMLHILWALASLNNRVAHRISGWVPWYQNSKCEHPSIGKVLSDAGMRTIEEYNTHCHKSLAQYISTRNISDILMVEERQIGSP